MNKQIMPIKNIQNLIFTIRDNQVMIDRDLAELYEVETKVLNQAVKRNIERFPQSFRFQLKDVEKNELVTNCDRFEKLKHSSVNPYAYTEQGVAMLSIKKHNEQYPTIKAIKFNDADDRFLIIDEKEVYHFGASLKDLGKKWFAVSKMAVSSVKVLDRFKQLKVENEGNNEI